MIDNQPVPPEGLTVASEFWDAVCGTQESPSAEERSQPSRSWAKIGLPAQVIVPRLLAALKDQDGGVRGEGSRSACGI